MKIHIYFIFSKFVLIEVSGHQRTICEKWTSVSITVTLGHITGTILSTSYYLSHLRGYPEITSVLFWQVETPPPHLPPC